MPHYFQDSATGKIWAFDDDVTVTETNGVYSFSANAGTPPTTLQPIPALPGPSAAELWRVYQESAKQALADDITPERILEAVALELNAFTSADVVAWVNYRRALRAIVQAATGTPGTLPAKPAYPAGT